MFGLGYGELLIIGIVAVLLFGGRLPQVARSLGKSLTEFKKGMSDLQSEMNDTIYHEPVGEVTYHNDHDTSEITPPTAPPSVEENSPTEAEV